MTDVTITINYDTLARQIKKYTKNSARSKPEKQFSYAEIRDRNINLIISLLHYPGVIKADVELLPLATEIEIGCYNSAIRICNDLHVVTEWANKKFIDRYSGVCYKVFSNMKLNKNLIYDIISGKIPPESVGSLTNEQLYTDGSREVRELLQIKNSQAIEDKYSDEVCRKCTAKKIVKTKKQTRSADEMETIFSECKECGYKYISG